MIKAARKKVSKNVTKLNNLFSAMYTTTAFLALTNQQSAFYDI